MRPVVLTTVGVDHLRPDLASRLLKITMQRPQVRRRESELHEQFKAQHALLFGAVLDLLVMVLAVRPDVQLEDPPRMAAFAHSLACLDFAYRGDACERFIAMQDEVADDVLEGDVVMIALRRWLDQREEPWTGTHARLLDELGLFHRGDSRFWPQHPKALSIKLRDCSGPLANQGITITYDRSNDSSRKRLLTIHDVRWTETPGGESAD
jgi:hypothetical protein